MCRESQRQWSCTARVACQKKVMRYMAECDVCHVWYRRHCMDIPTEVFGGEDAVHWECKRFVKALAKTLPPDS